METVYTEEPGREAPKQERLFKGTSTSYSTSYELRVTPLLPLARIRASLSKRVLLQFETKFWNDDLALVPLARQAQVNAEFVMFG